MSKIIIILLQKGNNKMYCDYLTGLFNMQMFYITLKNVLKKSIFTSNNIALICIDIDDFKEFNYAMGYIWGDKILMEFSKSLKSIIPKNSTIFRIEGDKFIILFEELTNINSINELCDEILLNYKDPICINDKQIHITASIGISIFPDDSMDIDNLIRYCEIAMNYTKSSKKGSYNYYKHFMSDTNYREFIIKQELLGSIEREELSLVYQPQFDARYNRLIGVEALLRWNNRKLGPVSPNEFIPIAEQTGYILEIGNWLINRICKNISCWNKKSYDLSTIYINVSPIEIISDTFKSNLLYTCHKYNINPFQIGIEITEKVLMKIDKPKINELKELINIGISIAIDDFGAEYSSLNYLMTLPFNIIKIDKSFLNNINCEKNKALILCIMNLSSILKCKVIVEGVETKEQVDILTNLGCNNMQGFYFKKPISQFELEKVFKNENPKKNVHII